MEKINVVIKFTLGEPGLNGLDKCYVKCEKFDSVNDLVDGTFDLLPNYPLENYVRFMLTKYHQAYGTQNQNPPQEE